MDTDGAFIDDSMVVLAEDGQALTYREDRIEAPNPRSIQKKERPEEVGDAAAFKDKQADHQQGEGTLPSIFHVAKSGTRSLRIAG